MHPTDQLQGKVHQKALTLTKLGSKNCKLILKALTIVAATETNSLLSRNQMNNGITTMAEYMAEVLEVAEEIHMKTSREETEDRAEEVVDLAIGLRITMSTLKKTMTKT